MLLPQQRVSVFLDTNCWINMADETKAAPVRVREKLRELVASGQVFCTLSWGILEELFDKSERFLPRTATLIEESSLNAVFINRQELYGWETPLLLFLLFRRPASLH
jgi:hypothetical protein